MSCPRGVIIRRFIIKFGVVISVGVVVKFEVDCFLFVIIFDC